MYILQSIYYYGSSKQSIPEKYTKQRKPGLNKSYDTIDFSSKCESNTNIQLFKFMKYSKNLLPKLGCLENKLKKASLFKNKSADKAFVNLIFS